MIKLKADRRAGAAALLVLRSLSACADATSQVPQDAALEENQNAWAQREPDQLSCRSELTLSKPRALEGQSDAGYARDILASLDVLDPNDVCCVWTGCSTRTWKAGPSNPNAPADLTLSARSK